MAAMRADERSRGGLVAAEVAAAEDGYARRAHEAVATEEASDAVEASRIATPPRREPGMTRLGFRHG